MSPSWQSLMLSTVSSVDGIGSPRTDHQVAFRFARSPSSLFTILTCWPSPRPLSRKLCSKDRTLHPKMPLYSTSSTPSQLLEKNESSSSVIYFVFFASNDPETKLPWCPDCRALDPLLERRFGVVGEETISTPSSEGPLGYLLTKDRSDWRKTAEQGNDWRADWDVQKIPTVVKLQGVSSLGCPFFPITRLTSFLLALLSLAGQGNREIGGRGMPRRSEILTAGGDEQVKRDSTPES